MRVLDCFPWLRALPAGLYGDLDIAEFATPTVDLDRVRRSLEASTGHLIMTYRLGSTGSSAGTVSLCGLIEPATLTPRQERLLRESEEVAASHGACLVAYRNPLRLRGLGMGPIVTIVIASSSGP